jgi:hypothetical protein
LRPIQNEASFLSGLRKEVSVFEHVLDFYVDAVEAARKGWDKAEGFSGSKAEKPGRSRRACRRVRKRLTFKP